MLIIYNGTNLCDCNALHTKTQPRESIEIIAPPSSMHTALWSLVSVWLQSNVSPTFGGWYQVGVV